MIKFHIQLNKSQQATRTVITLLATAIDIVDDMVSSGSALVLRSDAELHRPDSEAN